MNLSDVQARAWAAKHAHGFNRTDVLADIRRLRGEVDECEQAYTAGDLNEVALELADIVIYAAGLAQMIGVDIGESVAAKQSIIDRRVYIRDESGTLVKVQP